MGEVLFGRQRSSEVDYLEWELRAVVIDCGGEWLSGVALWGMSS